MSKQSKKPILVEKKYLIPFIAITSMFFLWGVAIMGAITYKNANEKNIDISYLVDKLSVKSRVVFKPNLSENKSYKKLFKLYSDLHDMFGDNKLSKNLFHIMKALKNIN